MLLIAGCGGGSSDSSTSGAPEPVTTTARAATAPTTAAPTTPGPDDDSEPPAPATTAGSSSVEFAPGDIRYRVVNLLDEQVDLYARTQGIVEAYLLESGVAAGAVTEFFAPPTDGRFLVTEAGAVDVTCVSTCPQFIAELTPFADNGPVHTVIVYDAAGTRASFDLWEAPTAASADNANAVPAPQVASGLVVVTAVALMDADFGLRLGIDGVAGCQTPANDSGVLVGGNQTPPFAYDGTAADILLYDNQDRECVGEPVGGPFTVEGGPGIRTHLILFGSPGDMGAVILPMDGDTRTPGSNSADSAGDRQVAVEALAEGLALEIGLADDEAVCAAGYVVEAMGLDVLIVDGELVDFETLGTDQQVIASEALVEAIEPCGIDPTLLTG